jgi:excisionase family DNA binding protein
MATGEEWLTPQELADELRLPKDTIYTWRSRGRGPRGHRIGRHVRFRRSDVNEWLRGLVDAQDGDAA